MQLRVQHSSHRARTRVLRVPQTHSGCFTCKKRKVRCDLQRPVCNRCMKAGRICDGFRNSDAETRESSAESESSLIQLPWRTATDDSSFTGAFEHIRLTKLGCDILHKDASQQHGLARSFWNAIPMLGQSDHLVAASMAVFGASVEASFLPNSERMVTFHRYYAIAVRMIQQQIVDPASASLPLMVACALLAVSEVVLGQDLSALSHLQGTLLVLQQKQKLLTDATHHEQEVEARFALNDATNVAGAILDIATATYALGLNLRLPPLTIPPRDLDPQLEDPSSSLNERLMLHTLHASYTWASNHFKYRYIPDRLVPKEAFIAQNTHCTNLFQRIQEMSSLVISSSPPDSTRALKLRAQCSACLIYCQNLLNPFEVSYDKFLASFSSIISDAEEVLEQQLADSVGDFKISLDLGIAQPLHFTALKCRDPQIRHKAITLLTKTGREGAFDGPRFAILAHRAAEIENSLIDLSTKISASSIPESNRLSYADIELEPSPDGSTLGVRGFFGRCRDVEGMLRAAEVEGNEKVNEEERWWEKWREYFAYSSLDVNRAQLEVN